MTKLLKLFRRGSNADDAIESITVLPNSRLAFDNFGAAYNHHLLQSFTYFELLPVITTVVATAEPRFLVVGTSAVSADVLQSTTGGIKMSTHGGNNDITSIGAIAATGMVLPISATSLIRFRTRVMLELLTTELVAVGLNQTRASADVDPTASAGEGATFVFDPGKVITTGLAAGAENNWILAWKINGVDSFADSGIPVVALRDYDFRIEIGTDLKPLFYIDEVLVGTGGALATASATVGPLIGVKALAAAARVIHTRFVSLGRAIG